MNSDADHNVTAATFTLGVIGHPVRHSLSPVLQNALLRQLGVDGCYHAFEVSADGFEIAVRGAGALGFKGLNVTVPHKHRAAKLCDELTPESQALGVANTLLFSDGKIRGHTTDPVGFLKPLEISGFRLAGGRVVILGAGGSARAVAYACAKAGASVVYVHNRTLERAQELVHSLRALRLQARFESLPLEGGSLSRTLSQANLIVNATSVGMWPDADSSPLPEGLHLPQGALAYDLVYNPLRTRFLEQAEQQGLVAQDGLDMLIYQAIASLEFWLQRRIPNWEALARAVRPLLESSLHERQ